MEDVWSWKLIDHHGRCVIFSKCGFIIIIGDDTQHNSIEMLLVTSCPNYSRCFVTNCEFRRQKLIATTKIFHSTLCGATVKV